MRCEQVEERISAYLDDMLAPGERREVEFHLPICGRCQALLTEMRAYDELLFYLPRASPSPGLHEHLFALVEVQELLQVLSTHGPLPHTPSIKAKPLSFPGVEAEPSSPPGGAAPGLHCRIFPGGAAPGKCLSRMRLPHRSLLGAKVHAYARRKSSHSRKLAIAAAVALVLLGGTLWLSLSLGHARSDRTALRPATGLALAAGERLVFLRAGALWSALADGMARRPERLTPATVTVAPGWTVSPPQGTYAAGNMLAYIDEQTARVHTVRSDGQQDTTNPQPLLPAWSRPNWQTSTGQLILASLAWSPDGSQLAFTADPSGKGQLTLFLAPSGVGATHTITARLNGSVGQPVWSRDGRSLAFTLASGSAVGVLAYQLKNRQIRELSTPATSRGKSSAGIYALGWWIRAGQNGVTWALGSPGQITAVWSAQLNSSRPTPHLLASGSYAQALYSPGSNNGGGGWLLVASDAGQAGDLQRLNLADGGQPSQLTRGQQVGAVSWSPTGASLLYLTNVANNQGQAHLLDLLSGADQPLPGKVASEPTPAWSADGQELAYSDGAQGELIAAPAGSPGQPAALPLQGVLASLSWSPANPHLLIATLNGPHVGLYLVDTQRNSRVELDATGVEGETAWTEIA